MRYLGTYYITLGAPINKILHNHLNVDTDTMWVYLYEVVI